MRRIYLDHAATTPVHPDVIKTMLPFFDENYGNSSSLYYHGQKARETIEGARASLARIIGAKPEEIIFSSGGTESNNTAIKGVAWARNGKANHIITSSIEHHAVLEPCHFLKRKGFSLTILPVDKFGLVDPDDVKKAITAKTILVSIMHANNEIGTTEPIEEIGKICREKGVYLHTDAVQTFGSFDINVDTLGIDLLSISAHKIYGPKGVGALYIREGTKITPLMHGGRQEHGKRASTQNTAGIVGLARAAEIAISEQEARVKKFKAMRDRLIEEITNRTDDVILNGHRQKRLPNNCHIIVRHVEGEAMLLRLNDLGIEVATGSACSTGSLEASHVLLAIGVSPVDAHGSLRISVGLQTTDDDIEYVIENLPKVVSDLRNISPLSRKSK